MLFKQRVLDLAREFASSSKQLALKSIEPHTASLPDFDLSRWGRLRFDRIIEYFLCLSDDDSTLCPPASIQVPAPVKDGKKFVVKLAITCLDWLKDKSSFTMPKEKAEKNIEEDEEETKEDKEEIEEDDEETEEAEEEDEEENEEDEDPFAKFKQVVASMDLDTLPTYASSLRRTEAGISSKETADFECTVDFKSMAGSFHILFPVVFNDGVKWLFKIPAVGYAGHWNESAARSLKSEALTMRMIQQKTSIPVPTVHSYDSSLDNEFNCPFILMDFIDGRPLYQKWYDGFTSAETQEKFRERALQTIAAATVQLCDLQYSQAGAPSFDKDDGLRTIEPVRTYDAPAMHSRQFTTSTDGDHLFCEIGPFTNAKDYFKSMLDRHNNPHPRFEAYSILLRLFISWIPDETPNQNERFVLAHPDLDLQNLLVADDGTLRGLIDWEGVSTVPRSVGCSFPKWLTLDWNTENYNYGQDIDCECENRHHSPDEMKHYRAMYAQFVHQAALKNKVRSKISALQLADSTSKSILIDNINRAAKSPFTKSRIVSDLLDKIAHVTCQNYFKAFCDVYEAKNEAIQSTKAVENNDQIEDLADADDRSSTNEFSDSIDSVFSKASRVSQDSTKSSDRSSIQSTKAVEKNDQIEDLADAEDQSSTDESSDSIDSVFSKASRVSQDSTNSSDPSSELDKEPVMELKCSLLDITNTNSRGVKRSASPDFRALFEENDTTSPKEKKHWRRVSSLVQKASRNLQSKVRRSNAGSASSACSSSEAQESIQSELSSKTSAHAIEDKPFGRDGRTVLATHKSTKGNTTANQTTAESYTGNQGHRIGGRDADRCNNLASSLGQSQDLLGSLHEQSEQGSDASPTNSLKGNSVQREHNLGRRLRGKLGLNHGKKANGVRASSPTLSAESGGSRRKRILAWIRKTSQKPLSGEQTSESSWESDSTLPKISQVSRFAMSLRDEANSKMNGYIEEVNGTAGEDAINMAKPFLAGAANFPSYDAGEPVDDGRRLDERFMNADICEDLVDGTLDEARMRRLRLGFAALLSSLQFSDKS